MSNNQQGSTNATLILLAVGIPCLFLGLMVLGQRQDVASLLFGAHFLFGIPVTQADGLKADFVGFMSTIWMLMSLTLIVAGVIVFVRNARPKGSPEGADAVAAPR